MPGIDRSAAAKCPQPLLPASESSASSQVSTTAALIWGEAAGPGLMSPLQRSHCYEFLSTVQNKPCRKAVAAAICQLFTEPSPNSLPRCCPWHLSVEYGFGLCYTRLQGFPPFLSYRKRFSQLPGFLCVLSTP